MSRPRHDQDKQVTFSYTGLTAYSADLVNSLRSLEIPHRQATTGLLYGSAEDNPTRIALDALDSWRRYQAGALEETRHQLVQQAYWLVLHEFRIGDDAGGWPLAFKESYNSTGRCALSAVTQAIALSVLLRAFQLTADKAFLTVARRVVHTFERDILDGGILAPVGTSGIFFESLAVYPAGHELVGCLLALLALTDYLAFTDNRDIAVLVNRCLSTVERFSSEFDAGYWTYNDLLRRDLASPSHLMLQITLLEMLAQRVQQPQWSVLAQRWRCYCRQRRTRLSYRLHTYLSACKQALIARIRRVLFPHAEGSDRLRVCVPVTAFPVTGGIRSVLAKVTQVMQGQWQLSYVTQHVGPAADGLAISRFGTALTSPRYFPGVYLYVLAGWQKLLALMRRDAPYDVLFPQDGLYTAAFTALAAQLAGVRVVCMDHGTLTVLKHADLRRQRLAAQNAKRWPRLRNFAVRLQDPLFWAVLPLLARLSLRLVDHWLIPGVEGDGVEEICRGLGGRLSCISRFATMIDIERYPVLDPATRAQVRGDYAITADAIVVTLICRLAPEKGIHVALESLDKALRALDPATRARVCIVIAGDGLLRREVEEDIGRRGLQNHCSLLGEIPHASVIPLLGASDIFLYTSTRGACLSMAILEAMASGCALIATPLPAANVSMLADGRGVIVPPGDAEETARELLRLLNNPELCRNMGQQARRYAMVHHGAAQFRRTLTRATCWSALHTLLTPSLANPWATAEKERD